MNEQKVSTSIDQMDELVSFMKEDLWMSSIANYLGVGIFVVNPHQERDPIVYVNEKFTRLTGYSRSEAVGRNFYFLQDQKATEQIKNAYTEVINQKKTEIIEIVNHRKDGTIFWSEVILYPVLKQCRTIKYIIGVQKDISEQKVSQKLIKENDQRCESLFTNHPDFVCSLDVNGYITSANKALERVAGYRIEEILNRSYQSFVAEESVDVASSFLRKALEGEGQEGHVTVRHKEGHSVYFQVRLIPICVDGEVVGIYAIAKDVTEYNKTQELLKKAEKLNVVGELAAGIAHEIRNPLTSLKGFIQLLRPNLADKQAYADVMFSELERIELIVSELLLLAKPQTSEFKKTNLKKLLMHIQTLLNTQAILNNTEIVMHYESKTTDIYCEENQMKQVFINFLKNAIEAMPSGGEIVIHVENINNDELLIQVTDEGEGIPEENLPKMGEPFYTTKERGTGLGLMISQKILSEHEGHLEFQSEVGKGTTVNVTVPIHPTLSKQSSEKVHELG